MGGGLSTRPPDPAAAVLPREFFASSMPFLFSRFTVHYRVPEALEAFVCTSVISVYSVIIMAGD